MRNGHKTNQEAEKLIPLQAVLFTSLTPYAGIPQNAKNMATGCASFDEFCRNVDAFLKLSDQLKDTWQRVTFEVCIKFFLT